MKIFPVLPENKKKFLSISGFLYAFALWLIATIVFGYYIWLASQNHFSQLDPMLEGTAPRPYVYRILAPGIIRILSVVLGITRYNSALLVMYVSLLGFTWTIPAIGKVLISSKNIRIFSLLSPLGLIPFLIEQRHVYDFPTLFLFVLALYFLAKNDCIKYLFVFTLATCSKETSLFLVLFFVLQYRTIERKKFIYLTASQVGIYAVIRWFTIELFRNNPGSLAEFHLSEHFHAYLQSPLSACLLFGAIVGIIWIGIIRIPPEHKFLRNALISSGGPTLLSYFLFGVPFEIRIFLETYPAIFLIFSLQVIRSIDAAARQ